MSAEQDKTSAFIARWQGVPGSEISNSQNFVGELCDLLGVPRPHTTPEQEYMFERPVTFQHGDGSTSAGRIDCYRRGAFIWESKKLRPGVAAAATGSGSGNTSKRFDDALLRARAQAESYARALPASEGRPPFLVVVDVGHVIELYAEFTRSGATYTPFPDPRSHRIRLHDLADTAVRDRLTLLWTNPLALDPARASAKVTREVSAELADLARSLEEAGHAPEQVAGFLTRCLFSMFAEDVGLLPDAADGSGSFLHLLRTYREQPATLTRMLGVFWAGMDAGGFNAAIAQDVLRFNGKLFKGASASGYVLPLTATQIDGLLRAAAKNWKEVEPAIFGTLLERALSATERHALGAHYTPRAYVERLVLPTVVEPLRADWANAQAAALLLAREADELEGRKREAKLEEARAEIRRFHHQLCTTRVLDPACGSGNFLYVTLEHLKRLEGEVLNQLDALGETQDKLGLEGETVTLQQLRGIELNERAAALAELVLWIGWLQWHIRTRGAASVAEPVVHDYGNIECRDAVLSYDRMEPASDADGKPLMRWDGRTMKKHPVTGEGVPDETAQVMQWRYVNPRQAEWPQADFIVGNPPFIGNKRMRDALGDGYTMALRRAWPSVPESADFVMYWWQRASDYVRQGRARQFGLITTNSLTMVFNRKIVESALGGKPALYLSFAVPDHPWVDSAEGAAVRISMTVARQSDDAGRLCTVNAERWNEENNEVEVDLKESAGKIQSDLRIGANVAAARELIANRQLAFRGITLLGEGFWVESDDPLATVEPGLLRRLRNGRDLTERPRDLFCIDAFGLSEDELRHRFPATYQRLLTRVKPERDVSERKVYRERWWSFAEPRPDFRAAVKGLLSYVVTPMTAKHRAFLTLPATVLPDQGLIAICLSDGFFLGPLSSVVHVAWSFASGGTLEDRPRYNNSRCFDTFPFPSDDTGLTPALTDRIRTLAEQIDSHRKQRQAAHEAVTLTGLYNVLDKLRRGEPLNAKDKLLHEQGLVSVLRTLHDELDAAVLQAYGWHDLGPVPWADAEARQAWTDALLERLVALNARRAAEEAQGTIRWLRPEYQDPARRQAATAQQTAIELPAQPTPADAGPEEVAATTAAAPLARQPWPAGLPEQMRAVADTLAATPAPLPEAALAERFTGRGPWKKRLPQILQTLEALGRARAGADGWRAA
ncbi:MAG: DNA methyltransferase [Burkholderiales bacterium]